MPRSATAGELALLQGNFNVHARAWIANADGTYVNLASLNGINYVAEIEIDVDIDQPIAQCTLRLQRDLGAGLSLAPFRTDSTLNRRDDGVTYATLVDPGRDFYVETAVTSLGGSPSAGDWKTMFVGITDVVDPTSNIMQVQGRDLGAYIADAWFADVGGRSYTDAPKPIEDVVQEICDLLPFENPPVTLYTPASPGFDVTQFAWSRESFLDALTRLVQSIGGDVRYEWDDGSASYRFTFTVPDRSKSVPDATFGPSKYITVDGAPIDRTDVRNSIIVNFGPANARGTTGLVEDGTSISRYKKRQIIVEEASDSAIDTFDEAIALANLIVSDLKDPKSEYNITMPYYWPLKLQDLLRFSANAVHNNTDQDRAVIGYTHLIGANGGTQHRTRIRTRGKPAGSYLNWIARAAKSQRNVPSPDDAVPTLDNFRVVLSADDQTADIKWDPSPLVEVVSLYQLPVPAGTSTDVLNTTNLAALVPIGLPAGTNHLTVVRPAFGSDLLIQAEPRSSSELHGLGPVKRASIPAAPFRAKVEISRLDEMAITVEDPGNFLSVSTPIVFDIRVPGTAKVRQSPTTSPAFGTSGRYTKAITLSATQQSYVEAIAIPADGTQEVSLGQWRFDSAGAVGGTASVEDVTFADFDAAADTITLSWTPLNAPAGAKYNLRAYRDYDQTGAPRGTFSSASNITSPYVWTPGFDIAAGHSSDLLDVWVQIEMTDSGGASLDMSTWVKQSFFYNP